MVDRARRQRWEDVRELSEHVVVEEVEASRLEPLEVLVERVHEHPERQIEFELRRGSREDQVPAGLGASAELGEQARLPDARLSGQDDSRRPPVIERRQLVIE
jgi:hypothetical protein